MIPSWTHDRHDEADHAGDTGRARVAFRDGDALTRAIDATWWPRSRNLAEELPPLIVALHEHGDRITRVSYNPEVWEPAPNRIAADGRVVRLGWFRSIDAHTLELSRIDSGRRVVVAVVLPEAVVHVPAVEVAAAAVGTAAA